MAIFAPALPGGGVWVVLLPSALDSSSPHGLHHHAPLSGLKIYLDDFVYRFQRAGRCGSRNTRPRFDRSLHSSPHMQQLPAALPPLAIGQAMCASPPPLSAQPPHRDLPHHALFLQPAQRAGCVRPAACNGQGTTAHAACCNSTAGCGATPDKRNTTQKGAGSAAGHTRTAPRRLSTMAGVPPQLYHYCFFAV